MNARGKWREGRTDRRFTFNRQVEVKRKMQYGKFVFKIFSFLPETTLKLSGICFSGSPMASPRFYFLRRKGGHRLGNLHTLTHWGGKVHTLAQTLSQEHISNHVLISLFILAEHISSHGDMSKLFWLENSKERGGGGRETNQSVKQNQTHTQSPSPSQARTEASS